jgi:hypothetical protein
MNDYRTSSAYLRSDRRKEDGTPVFPLPVMRGDPIMDRKPVVQRGVAG